MIPYQNLLFTTLAFGDESITITCTKINSAQTGTLVAFVNGVSASKTGPCSSYFPGSTAEIFCIKQAFGFVLRSAGVSRFDIDCRLAESGDIVVISLIRLCKSNFFLYENIN